MRYPAYKSTGIKWLPEVPEHWYFRRAKFLYRKECRSVTNDDKVVTCFRDGTVTLRENRRTTGFTESIQECGYQGIRKGDLVIHVMDAFAGAIGVSDSDGKGTPVYNVCTAFGDSNNYYYALLLRTMAKTGFIQSLYRGIRERSSDFRFEVFKNQWLPVPPRPEQDQIVRYLNWKIGKIDKLIALKKRQIECLQDLKKAVVNEAVTKGLDPNVEMVDSGVAWLGKIPKGWSVVMLSQVAFERNVKNTGMKEDNLLSLSYGNIVEKNINTTDGLLPENFEGYQIVYPGDTVMRLTDLQNDHTSLRTGLVKEKGIITSAYTCICPRENISPEYLRFELHVADLHKFFYGLGGGVRQSIGYKDIRHVGVFVPMYEEQENIVQYVNNEFIKLDDDICVITETIERLQEFRTRLVADVVTGQVDVRGSTPPVS